MSLEATLWAYKQTTTNRQSKFTLVVLADCHNGISNQCNPSISHIAKICQISPRSVKEHLKLLEADGLIRSRPRYGKCGRLTNQYILNIAGLPSEEVEEVFEDDDEEIYPVVEPERKQAAAPAATPPIESSTSSKPNRVRDAVERLFTFYCVTFGRSERDYTLTPFRRTMAENRLMERMRPHLGDVGKAEMDLAKAIENVAASDYHQERGFVDWGDQIFRTREQFEKQLHLKGSGDAKGQRNSGGGKPSPAAQRRETSRNAIRAAASRRYGIGVVGADGSTAGTVPESGTWAGNSGDVPDTVGEDRPSVRPSDVSPRIIEAVR